MRGQLRDVFTPVSVEDFTRNYLGQHYLMCRGDSERWADLLTWPDINTMLTGLRVAGSRIRLVKNGVPVAPAIYMRDPRHPDGTELITAAVEQEIGNGATLIVDHIHELSTRIREFATELEAAFRTMVGANAYVATGGQMAFDLHWDSHDTLILQIGGQKRWRVFQPTTPHPLAPEDRDKVPHPTAPPIWEGVLHAGDVLYMPRGWWHAAVPDSGFTMHVTFSMHHATGLDYLHWAIGRLRARGIGRDDLPAVATATTQEAYVAALIDALTVTARDCSVEKFLTYLDSKRAVVHPFHLPPKSTMSLPLTQPLVLSRQRALYVELTPDGQHAHFDAVRQRWKCSAALQPALGLLNHARGHSVEALTHTLTPGSAAELKRILTALLMAGALRAEMSPLATHERDVMGFS